jgi:hypothetical protein
MHDADKHEGEKPDDQKRAGENPHHRHLCRVTACRRACQAASGSITTVKIA